MMAKAELSHGRAECARYSVYFCLIVELQPGEMIQHGKRSMVTMGGLLR
jgi:hypothetical protein